MKTPRKNKAVKPVKGWVEIDDKGQIVVGNLGVKVWKHKYAILEEGFDKSELLPVLIAPLSIN